MAKEDDSGFYDSRIEGVGGVGLSRRWTRIGHKRAKILKNGRSLGEKGWDRGTIEIVPMAETNS